MNDYDDLDDYSSGNSFRARSNTWPLNRPDFPVPSLGANIDETLPEIELEDDDLFTTNENWTTGMVDHDIMSWDPILNAQNHHHHHHQQQQQQQQQQQALNQPSTVHHHHQQPSPQQQPHHQAQATQPQIHAQQQHQTSHQLTQLVPSLQQTSSDQTRHQQSIHHLQNHIHQQPPPPSSHQHQHNHRHQPQTQDPTQHLHQQQHQSDQTQPQLIHPQQQHPPPPQPHHHHQQQHPHTQHHHHHQHQQQQHQRNDNFLDGVSLSSIIVSSQDSATAQLQAPNQQQQTQLPHQTSPQPHHQHVQHQTLNSVHRLEHEDVNEYNLQLQHLHIDNNHLPRLNDTTPQDHPFVPKLTSLCVHNTTTTSSAAAAAAAATAANIRNDNYNISPDPSHHDLQPLTSARFDLEPTNIVDYDLKEPHGGLVDPLDPHISGHHLITQQQPHLHEQPQQLIQHHQHPLEYQPHQIQSHHSGLISSSLDDHSTAGSNVISSSLGTSGIGLSADLEDLDYKHNVDSVNFLQVSHSDEQPRLQVQQQQQQQSEIHQQSSDNVIANDTKQRSNSTSTPKAAKQNVPRRNAWGNLSYADLISQAINSTSDKRLTLSQIYDWMVQHVPYFKDKGDSNSSAGWKNSVRHNLSLHSRFKRLQNEGTGKSSWWTINPEANVGKCARRRAASMEASKYEKKRGRAKKKADAIRAGLVSYPSLTNSSLNGSSSTLEQQAPSQAQSISQFHNAMGPGAAGSSSGLQQSDTQLAQEVQQQQPVPASLEQFANAQEYPSQQLNSYQPTHRPELQFHSLDQYGTDRPSQHQQQQLQQLQQSDARSWLIGR